MRMLLASMALLSGCVTATQMNRLSVGMNKALVFAKIGEPASMSVKDEHVTYLNYRFSETDWDWWLSIQRPYFVRLIDDKVETFGREGDFGTTDKPVTRVDIRTRNESAPPSGDRLDQLKKLNDLRVTGALTEEEFQSQKARILAD